jgi:transposase InsO family protein
LVKPIRLGLTETNGLLDTGATGGSYISEDCAQLVCDQNGIAPIYLSRPKPVIGYNGKPGKPITQAIYPKLDIQGHIDNVLLYITQLHRPVILGKSWMAKHGVVLDLTDDSIQFKEGVCQHSQRKQKPEPDDSAVLLNQPERQNKVFKPRAILRRPANQEDFTGLSRKLNGQLSETDASDLESNSEDSTASESKKKRRRRPKLKAQRQKDKVKEQQQASSLTLGYASICMIGAAPFRMLTRQKGAQVFSITMQDIYAEKQRRAQPPEPADCDPSKLPKEFRSRHLAFSKKEADTLPPHRDSDHHITLEKEASAAQLGHAPLYRMSDEELRLVKEYLDENVRKNFIVASQAPFASPVLFVRKPGGGLRFCVDYRKLNALTKKDRYPLPLIEETLAQITGAKILSKIDIRHAFNRIRMATDEDEDLTTFKTRFGTYKYKVLPFGLCNGPATFQHYMNDVLWEGLNEYLSVYMDDILVYSQTREEHVIHVQRVLDRLIEAGLQADIAKCEFFVTETKFLGLIVGIDGIRMDPAKVQAIVDWIAPTNVHEVRAFLGFCNFYRRFIRAYSKLVRSLIELTRKDSVFDWSDKCQQAFQAVKDAVISAPILRHFDRTKTCYVECDASDFVTAGVLSQRDDDGVLHPVAFFSRKMAPAECNYEIYDKELLAIIRCFEEWRPDLEGSDLPIQVLTDHKSLEYFMTTKRLTRRQARWAEFLADYNFQITYRPGKDNQKADALTRRPGDRPSGPEDDRQKEMSRVILTPERIHPDVECALQIDSLEPIKEPEQEPELADRIRQSQAKDPLCVELRKALDQEERTYTSVSLAHCDITDGLLRYQQKVWIPEDLYSWICKEVHTQPMVGHPGIAKTLALLKRQYYWPRMDRTVARYISNCHECKRSKPTSDKYNRVLIPLPIPQQPWQDISMDFITHLPLSKGYDSVLVVTCRLTKQRHFIACSGKDHGTTSEETANLVIQQVVKLHGLPDTIVSDRGPQFVAEFWKHLCRILRIKSKLSTAFHPETDGQTEVENKELERYLRAYVAYQQDDWSQWLAMAEFAANNAPSATTKVSPFFANLGYYPRLSFDIKPEVKPPRNAKEAIDRETAVQRATELKDLWAMLQDEIGLAQTRMEGFADAHRKPAPAYQVGDLVWLSARNIQTQRPTKKLDHKNLGPYKVLEKIGATSYRLQLPPSIRIHPVFHSNLLRLDPNDPLPGQHPEPAPPVYVDGEEEYEVEQILDSRLYGRAKKLQYRVNWVGYPPDTQWYPAANFENSPDKLQAFHTAYPGKPGP